MQTLLKRLQPEVVAVSTPTTTPTSLLALLETSITLTLGGGFNDVPHITMGDNGIMRRPVVLPPISKPIPA